MYRYILNLCALELCILCIVAVAAGETPITIEDRRELFVDEHLIGSKTGDISLKLHEPTPREIALTFDQPWEGNTSGYPTVMFDGELYRMIYRGHRMTWKTGKLLMENSPVVCYAESNDGIHWKRPILNIHKWLGKDRDKLETPTVNNIVWPGSSYSGTFVPFEDTNPECRPDQRFKALGGNHRVGLHLFTSSDAIHWKKREEPIFHEGALDSMNTMFWDELRNRYTLYFRTVRDGLRSIDVTHSKDLTNWTKSTTLLYGESPPQQMYTNGIEPYYRAPHLMVGFPTRYTARTLSNNLAGLPPKALRRELGNAYPRIASDLSDGLFMTSRDGTNFKRWDEAFIRPKQESPGNARNWMYGDNYQSYGLFPTKDKNGQPEISFLVSHGYWQEYKSHIRRYSIRPDGFVSLNAKYAGGEVVTKPIRFSGTRLELNYATSAAGSLKVELLGANGTPLEGFSLKECEELTGNSLHQIVSWQGGGLSRLAGKPIRLRFVLKDADLFSFKFSN